MFLTDRLVVWPPRQRIGRKNTSAKIHLTFNSIHDEVMCVVISSEDNFKISILRPYFKSFVVKSGEDVFLQVYLCLDPK